MLICGCQNKKNKDMYLKNELQHLRQITNFQGSEILEIRSRFYKLTNNNKTMNISQFREMMGLMGMEESQSNQLSERIYKLIDIDRDGQVGFKEYISYLNIMIHGNQQQKQKYTFDLIDIDRKGYFDIITFSELIRLFIGLWTNVTRNTIDEGAKIKLDQHIEDIYWKLDPEKKEKVDFKMFKEALRLNPNLLEIFDFLSKGMHENIVINDEQYDKKKSFKIVKEVFKIEMGIQNIVENLQNLQKNIPRNENISKSLVFVQKSQNNYEDLYKSEVRQRHKTQGDYQKNSEYIINDKIFSNNKNDPIMEENEVNSVAFSEQLNYQYSQKKELKNIQQQFENKGLTINNINININQQNNQIIQKVESNINTQQECNSYDIHPTIKNQKKEVIDHSQIQKIQNEDQGLDIEQIDIDLITDQSLKDSIIIRQFEKNLFLNQKQNDDDRNNNQYLQNQNLQQIQKQLVDLFKNTIQLRNNIEQDLYKMPKNKEQKDEQINLMLISQNVPKKKRKATKNENKFKNLVFFGHQNQILIQNMMTGIMMAVRSAQQNKQQLQYKDFSLKYYFELVPQNYQDGVESSSQFFQKCKFYDYAPMVFKEIRNMMGISYNDYLQSIGPQKLFDGFLKAQINSVQELVSSGKSGSFFYYSSDGRYILKTIKKDEFQFLKQILKSYHDHLLKYPNSRMVKFYGMHQMRIKVKDKSIQQKMYFVIFNNLFQTYKEIHQRYDIKGSLYGRKTPPNLDPSIALKDLDALNNKLKINIPNEQAVNLYQSLVNDSEFFIKNQIIDYSLLIGIHHKKNDKNIMSQSQDIISYTDNINLNNNNIIENQKAFEEKGIQSLDGNCTYFIGVIDILTQFNTKKKLEYMAKSIAFGKTISAIPPKQYSQRYLEFIKQLLSL